MVHGHIYIHIVADATIVNEFILVYSCCIEIFSYILDVFVDESTVNQIIRLVNRCISNF